MKAEVNLFAMEFNFDQDSIIPGSDENVSECEEERVTDLAPY